uniref:P2 protein n=1 Tax=Nettle badnavirus 1 TaxID=3158948 RepID=A0AAU7GJ67_9VIRU
MSTWQLAAAKDSYQEAIKATATLTSDNRAVGFVEPHRHPTNLSDTHIQRQNNTLIHLLIQSIEEIKAVRDQLQIVTDRINSLDNKGKEVALPDDVINQLTAQLKEASFGEKKVKGKGKGSFRVWN